MLEHFGHPEWGVLATPRSTVRLLAVGLIIGGVLGSGLVSSIIKSEREELSDLLPRGSTQSTASQPSGQPPVAPSMMLERQAGRINGSSAGKDLDTEHAAPLMPTYPGNHRGNIEGLATETATETLESGHSSDSALALPGLPSQEQTSAQPVTQNPPTKRELIAPSSSPPAESLEGSGNGVGARMREPQRPSSSRALANLSDQEQTSERPAIPNPPRKRELSGPSSSHAPENMPGKANAGAKMGEPQKPPSSRVLANPPDQEQMSERPAIQNPPRKRESIAPMKKPAAHRQSDEAALFFQPWWNGEARGDPRLRNSPAQQQAGELAPFFRWMRE